MECTSARGVLDHGPKAILLRTQPEPLLGREPKPRDRRVVERGAEPFQPLDLRATLENVVADAHAKLSHRKDDVARGRDHSSLSVHIKFVGGLDPGIKPGLDRRPSFFVAESAVRGGVKEPLLDVPAVKLTLPDHPA